MGVISLALESQRSIAWACRLLPLGRVLCLISSRALTLLVRFMAAVCTPVPTFKIQILTGIGVAIFTGVPFGLGGLLGCWARRPFAVFFFCKALGHLELFCPSKKSSFGFPLASFPAFGSRAILVGNRNSPDHSTWFRSPVVSLSGGPPYFSCFEEFAREVLKKSESSPLQYPTLSLGVTSPKPQTAPSPATGWRYSLPVSMAYRRVDPEPFLPPGFSASVVLHREVMARSVTRRLPPLHEDWAIINIKPLPEHEVTFPAVRDVVREYLVEHRRLGVRDIQRSHLGQVLVQFSSVLERDNLVLLGPQNYLDATFTALRHNDAWNHRALFFNCE
jgi:hypothetical protein